MALGAAYKPSAARCCSSWVGVCREPATGKGGLPKDGNGIWDGGLRGITAKIKGNTGMMHKCFKCKKKYYVLIEAVWQ